MSTIVQKGFLTRNRLNQRGHFVNTLVKNALHADARVLALCLFGLSLIGAQAQSHISPDHSSVQGIVYACDADELRQISTDMARWFQELGIRDSEVVRQGSADSGFLAYTLTTPDNDTRTLDLHRRYALKTEQISLPTRDGRHRTVQTVSRKEIVLALLQHGRRTELGGAACNMQALREHVGLRQHIAAWAQELQWGWPEGGPPQWNPRYWHKGTPHANVALHEALQDMFSNQSRYEIGCYAATKTVYAHAVLDYYRRVLKDPAKTELVAARLMADQEPLVFLEPQAMWSFEPDFDPSEQDRPGKVLAMQRGVAPGNFVPGDWSYFLNTDPRTYEKTGYEGSNAIYLGRGRFDDYYNDNHHSYTYQQKLDQVYQWRNHVFSRSRDKARIEKLSAQRYRELERTPAQGGLVLDLRVAPYLFGFEALPPFRGPGAQGAQSSP